MRESRILQKKPLPKFQKSATDAAWLRNVLQEGFFIFDEMDEESKKAMIDAFKMLTITSSKPQVIKQGDTGDFMYCVQHGVFKCSVEGKGVVGTVSRGGIFGELALIYNAPRAASVQA